MDQDKINDFRQQQEVDSEKQKQQQNHEELAGSLNNILMATMVSKDPRMVEVAKNLTELLEGIDKASKDFKGSNLQLLPVANHNLAKAVASLSDKVEKYSPHDLKPYFDDLKNAVAKLATQKPTASAPAQAVNVNLKPLVDTLEKHLKKEDDYKVELSCYRAQDIDNDGETTQYVGFLNPDSEWYIIENDLESNSMRWVFGKEGYKQAWEHHVGQRYKLLDEAINAVYS